MKKLFAFFLLTLLVAAPAAASDRINQALNVGNMATVAPNDVDSSELREQALQLRIAGQDAVAALYEFQAKRLELVEQIDNNAALLPLCYDAIKNTMYGYDDKITLKIEQADRQLKRGNVADGAVQSVVRRNSSMDNDRIRRMVGGNEQDLTQVNVIFGYAFLSERFLSGIYDEIAENRIKLGLAANIYAAAKGNAINGNQCLVLSTLPEGDRQAFLVKILNKTLN